MIAHTKKVTPKIPSLVIVVSPFLGPFTLLFEQGTQPKAPMALSLLMTGW
jgi:hypothetical protein